MSATVRSWVLSPKTLTIQENEIHVWRADLDSLEVYLERLLPLLSKEELDRADRFFFSKDRNRFILSHACLRDVLSRYLMVEPDQISFVHNAFGKPSVSTQLDATTLEFNLTHSHRFALVAVAKGLQVGVDVELIRQDFGGLKIARRFFSPEEYQTLHSLAREQQSKAFFDCWTRKEAYIKAKGIGLSLPLDEFDVTLRPGEPARLINTRSGPSETGRWTLVQVDPDIDYAGTVAVEGYNLILKCWDWSPKTDMSQLVPSRAHDSSL